MRETKESNQIGLSLPNKIYPLRNAIIMLFSFPFDFLIQKKNTIPFTHRLKTPPTNTLTNTHAYF